MELSLDGANFKPGDKITGTAKLKLKKDKDARAVRVVVEARRKMTRRTSKGTTTKDEIIYTFDKILDGEKKYVKGTYEYPFEIRVPDPLPLKEIGGKLGMVLDTVTSLMGTQLRWYVIAKLDIPGGMDISKSQQINVGE